MIALHPLHTHMTERHLLVNADELLESLLSGDDTISGQSLNLSLSSSPTLSEEPMDHFPCIADELEEQAKQLEEEWFGPSQPLGAAAAKAAAAGGQQVVHPLRLASLTSLELLQRQMLVQEGAAEQRQQEAEGQEGSGCCAATTVAAAAVAVAAAVSRGAKEPSTPQRASNNDSSCNESGLPAGPDHGEVQSPAPVSLVALPCAPTCAPFSTHHHQNQLQRRAPLQMAIRNAQCVRLGQQPATPGAWRGCGRSAWCSAEPRHAGVCDASATVPGLLAYPAQELFESGVNIEELCRVPEELAGPLDLGGELEDDRTSGKGKRRSADEEPAAAAAADDGASHSQTGGAGSGGRTASTGSQAAAAADMAAVAAAAEGEQQHSASGSHAAKRLRTAGLSTEAQSAPASAPTLQPLPLQLVPTSSGMAAAAGMQQLSCPSGMVPVAPPPLPPLAPPVPTLGPGISRNRNRGRPAGAPRLRPIQRPAVPPPTPAGTPAATAATPNKPVTRQLPRTPEGGAAPVAPRPSGRKTILQWHTDTVTDPRTGATVSVVEPGTFCTQCYALSTPVWRAGPFGVKTLCNACGVRWMKASKSSKK